MEPQKRFPMFPRADSVNYLHMGRFFEYLMFRHEALAEFDYVWRLDADIETRLGIPCLTSCPALLVKLEAVLWLHQGVVLAEKRILHFARLNSCVATLRLISIHCRRRV